MGISRSATLVLATLMRDEGLTLGEAAQTVRQVRPRIAPNRRFCAELRALEVELFREPRTLAPITGADCGVPAAMPEPTDLSSWVALWLQARREGASETATDLRDGVLRCVTMLAPAALQAALGQTIRTAWETYGGGAVAQRLARRDLGELLHHLVASGPLCAAGVQQSLEHLSAGDAWQDLLLDVPLAAEYLHELDAQVLH